MLRALHRLAALFRLALRALVLHPWTRLLRSAEQSGKGFFLASYRGEGLVPYTREERAAQARFHGCINCGLCDAVCPTLAGPSLFALAYSRATPELRALRGPLAALEACGDCHACQSICPRGVPLLEVFAFAKRKAEEVERA